MPGRIRSQRKRSYLFFPSLISMVSSMMENIVLTIDLVIDIVGNTVVWRKCQDHSIRRGRSIFGLRDFTATKE